MLIIDVFLVVIGRLYQSLCSTTHEIPIGIYRTDTIPRDKEKDSHKVVIFFNH